MADANILDVQQEPGNYGLKKALKEQNTHSFRSKHHIPQARHSSFVFLPAPINSQNRLVVSEVDRSSSFLYVVISAAHSPASNHREVPLLSFLHPPELIKHLQTHTHTHLKEKNTSFLLSVFLVSQSIVKEPLQTFLSSSSSNSLTSLLTTPKHHTKLTVHFFLFFPLSSAVVMLHCYHLHKSRVSSFKQVQKGNQLI